MSYRSDTDYGPRNGGKSSVPASVKLIGIVAVLIIGLIIFFTTVSGTYVNVNANEIVVKQAWVSGELSMWTDPGIKPLWWGKDTHYDRSRQFWFSSKTDQGTAENQAVTITFNDGGHAQLSGSVRYNLPLDEQSMLKLHKDFHSKEAIDQSLIRTVFEKAIYLSGQQMSSTESYQVRRNDLLYFIEDQAAHGVYKSSSKCDQQLDPVTKQNKTVCITSIEKGPDGKPLRVEQSPLEVYHISLSNLSINELKYDKAVNDQIVAQQAAIAAVQTSAAQARQAEQNALTAEKNGEAAAAKAKWEQEVIKAKEVTQGEQRKEVARLAKEAAEYTKQEQTLLGEGEGARKKAAMMANGALEERLAAAVKMATAGFVELGKQRLVPEIVMGGGSVPNGAAAMNDMIQLITLSALKQAGLAPTTTVAKK
jgi:SPFH domain / Band 7 family